jgi:hypothetical protein
MKTQFKSLLLIFITSASCYAQRHRIVDKSFEVDKNTSIVINLDNVAVAIEESTDGKIHFDYVMEFDGFSKKKIQEFIDNVKIEVSNSSNHISLIAKSVSKVDFERIEFNAPQGISMSDIYFKPKLDEISRKSKDSLLKEIRFNNRSRLENPLEYVNERFKINKNGKLKNFTRGGLNLLVSQFVIKIPPFVQLEVKAENSSIYFKNDMQNRLKLDFKDGDLKTKALLNFYNEVNIDNATFEAELIEGGEYKFKNIKKGKLASIRNTTINSNFSKYEVGEISGEVSIIDLNSEIWLYNYSEKLDDFYMSSEYSRIHFFEPKKDFYLRISGSNVKHIGNNAKTYMEFNNSGYPMIVRDPKDKNSSVGAINFEMSNGIIYTHEESLKESKK